MDVITTHLHADFDGVASMVAARKLYPNAALVLPGSAQETPREFLQRHALSMTPLTQLDRSQVTRLVMVDTQEPNRLGVLEELYDDPRVAVHIYDHHPERDMREGHQSDRPIEVRVVERVGATTTLLIERLRANGIALSAFEATVLTIGLYEETGSLSFPSTTPRDLEAAAHLLRSGADLRTVADTLRRPLEAEQIALLDELVQAGEALYVDGHKVLLTSSAVDRYRGDLAEVVQQLAELKGYDTVLAALALGDKGHKVQLIGRSRTPAIDVADIASAFGGGGHPGAAAATIHDATPRQVRERIRTLLVRPGALRERPRGRTAQDVMTRPVKTISEAARVSDAAGQMTRQELNTLPVLDRRGRYHGIISRETVQKALFHGLGNRPLHTIMQTDVYSASPATPFSDVQTHMIERNQRFVPVLEEHHVVGAITRTDLLRAMHADAATAGAPVEGRAEALSGHGYGAERNLRHMMKDQLPGEVFSLLEQAGRLGQERETPVYVVGGFVRDLLLTRPNLDVDLVVEGDGLAYAEVLGRTSDAQVTTHPRFGTAVLTYADGFALDVATARTEYYKYPTALPTVEQSSIKQDLYRRDFTINTLAIRLDGGGFGQLLDFYGGQRDLHDGTIRVLHSLSFLEDPTRVFRAVRFEQRFGFRLGKETLALIRDAVNMKLFDRLSADRLRQELVQLLSEDEPRKAISRLAELNLLQFIHPDLVRFRRLSGKLKELLKRVEQAVDWYTLASLNWQRPPNSDSIKPWLVYVAALLAMLSNRAAREALTRLKFGGREAETIRLAQVKADRLPQSLRRPKLRTFRPSHVYRILSGLPDELLVFLLAKARHEETKRQITAFMTEYRYVTPLLSGMDLKAMGLTPGPTFKRLLERLRSARLDGEVNTEADERAVVQSLIRIKRSEKRS